MRSIVILGSGGHAKVVIDILRAMGGFHVLGCIADDSDPDRLVSGVPIIGRAECVESLAGEGHCAAIGVGGWADNKDRIEVFERAVASGVEIVTAIHPQAHVSPSAVIGRGSVIFPGATIGTEAVVGQNVIIATNSSVDHESQIEDHVLISAGVSIGAHVTLEWAALVAIGATVASGVTVGCESLVAAGAIVIHDVPEGASVRGVPAPPK
jgi:sugar O-acyltransferase (sialic acid O-acetyltransferase NeuD family)